MAKKKILILHYNLQAGGAERVLVNLLKYLSRDKYDVTLKTIFGAGPYVKSVPKDIRFSYVFKNEFKGFNTLMKLFSGKLLHRLFIHDRYDIEIAYLENSPTRIVSSCPHKETKKVGWVHTEVHEPGNLQAGFRNKEEMIQAYNRLDYLVFVARRAMECFQEKLPAINVPSHVLHNVNDIELIKKLSKEPVSTELGADVLNICFVGRLVYAKGVPRLVKAFSRLKKDDLLNKVRLYVIGRGEDEEMIRQSIIDENLTNEIIMLGFDKNPYRYISKMDLFACSSYREGYSTATTEAIALGVPVFTTDCSGMDEILDNGRFGMIVPNDDESIYQGLKDLLTHREKINLYAEAIRSGANFTTQALVDEYEKFFDSL